MRGKYPISWLNRSGDFLRILAPGVGNLKIQNVKSLVEREAGEKKQRSLRNAKLKANRASVTEEQRKERLRIRRKKDRAKRIQEEEERVVSKDNENQRQATLKRLKRGDENELEKNLRLEKVVASKQLKFAMEMDVERKARGDGGRKKSKKRNEFNLDLISKTFFLQGISSLAL